MRKLTIFLAVTIGWILYPAVLGLAQVPELRERLAYYWKICGRFSGFE